MSRKKPEKRKKAKAITAKRVQATEDEPVPEVGTVDIHPEIDEDAWGDDGLTLKQRRFCLYYVSEAAGNATKAAELAGYSTDNRLVLGVTAHENLKKPNIRSFIGRLLARQGMTPDFLKSRLAQLAQSSFENFATIDKNGHVIVDLEQGAALGALSQVKELKEETLEAGEKVLRRKRTFKIHNPIPAIRTLAEMNGMLGGQPQEQERQVQRRQMRIGVTDDAGDADHN